MGKNTAGKDGKRAVLAFAKAKTPALSDDKQKLSFKDCKRRSILAGLRVLKAPAVTRQASSSGWLLSTAKTVVYLHQLVEHRKELQQPLKPSFLMPKTKCLGT